MENIEPLTQTVRRNVPTDKQTHIRVSVGALQRIKAGAKERGVSVPVYVDDLLNSLAD
jgi:predicted DNA binding CopG/RHH family protein